MVHSIILCSRTCSRECNASIGHCQRWFTAVPSGLPTSLQGKLRLFACRWRTQTNFRKDRGRKPEEPISAVLPVPCCVSSEQLLRFFRIAAASFRVAVAVLPNCFCGSAVKCCSSSENCDLDECR
ncbi:hypothetical protein Y032_0009g575 [Ancylostoma ceylanicum]|uniref:Uncharacterized protein n=1 Tax=Ancylostoma ceylanicum TaxID=53326 RepID=A0A016VIF0_9BILA|nr:hypothetical protein Y032_0009g575 [Ancylostoma ceylanicum]